MAETKEELIGKAIPIEASAPSDAVSKTSASAMWGIAEADRATVLAQARDLVPLLEEWRSHYPALLAPRVTATALVAAAMLPTAPLSLSLDIAALCLVLFGLDDVTDGIIGGLDAGGIATYVAGYCATAADPNTERWQTDQSPDIIGLALQEVCRRLYAAPNAALYYGWWVERFAQVGAGFLAEIQMTQTFQKEASLPDYDTYMAIGQETIVAPAFSIALCLLLALPESSGDTRLALAQIARDAGRCIRLVNDVRSFAREKAQGKPNSLTVRMAEAGISETEAANEAVEQADRYLGSLHRSVTELPPAFREWGDTMERMTRFLRAFYLAREFHQPLSFE